jgi:ABC-2 type transport system ATP-binding protein/heme exporter protein A
MKPPLQLTASNVTKFFGEIPALVDVSMTIQPGEWVLILGHNGSGKSTYLRLLTQLTRPDAGMISWSNAGGPPVEPVALWSRIGYLSHQSLMYESLSVTENVALQMKLRGARADLDGAVRRLRLERYANRPIKELSQGTRARASLLAATIHDPDILILDEPTAAFDDQGVEVLLSELVRLNQTLGVPPTVFCASHDLARLGNIAQRLIVFEAGRVALDVGTERRDDAFERYRSSNR